MKISKRTEEAREAPEMRPTLKKPHIVKIGRWTYYPLTDRCDDEANKFVSKLNKALTEGGDMSDEKKIKEIRERIYGIEDDIKYLDLDDHEKADAGGWLADCHGKINEAIHAIETVCEQYK